MPTRIETILTNARYSLADPGKDRYTDIRLLSLISDAQRDIARNTRLLKAEVTIPIQVNEAVYDLPDDTWMITRAIFDNVVIGLMSHDRMDQECLGWFTQFGSKLTALIYDRRDMLKVRVYPRPNNDYFTAPYSFVSDSPLVLDPNGLTPAQLATIHAAIDQLTIDGAQPVLPLADVYTQAGLILSVQPGEDDTVFGVVTSIDGIAAAPAFGVVSGLELVHTDNITAFDVFFTSPFGVVTNVQDVTGLLHLYYIKDPKIITKATDVLELAPLFDRAITLYTVGMAFADDLDTQNQERSASALALYKRELDTVGTPTDFTDGTRATQYAPNYITPFGE